MQRFSSPPGHGPAAEVDAWAYGRAFGPSSPKSCHDHVPFAPQARRGRSGGSRLGPGEGAGWPQPGPQALQLTANQATSPPNRGPATRLNCDTAAWPPGRALTERQPRLPNQPVCSKHSWQQLPPACCGGHAQSGRLPACSGHRARCQRPWARAANTCLLGPASFGLCRVLCSHCHCAYKVLGQSHSGKEKSRAHGNIINTVRRQHKG